MNELSCISSRWRAIQKDAAEIRIMSKSDPKLEDITKQTTFHEVGTIGNGHYLGLLRRCERLSTRIDQLAAIIDLQADQWHQIQLQIDELKKRFEHDEQQREHMISTFELWQDSLEVEFREIHQRIYAIQDVICKPTMIFPKQPVEDATWEVESNVSKESSSASLETRTMPSLSETEEIDEHFMSPNRERAFRRSQGLDVNADPFQMPIPQPDAVLQYLLEENSQHNYDRNSAQRNSISYKPGRRARRRNKLNRQREQFINRQPSPGLERPNSPPSPTEPVGIDPSGDSCVDYVKAMCKQFDVPNQKEKKQDDQQKRPPPRRIQPMSGKTGQHRRPQAKN